MSALERTGAHHVLYQENEQSLSLPATRLHRDIVNQKRIIHSGP